jgi:hypothetical protein
MKKRRPVGRLVGLRIRSEFLRTIPTAMKIRSTSPRNRRVTAEHISGGFGVSGV